ELFEHLIGAAHAWRQISISCTVDFAQALPEDVHLTLYRITQEALNNIIKHSKATEASITLRKETGKLVLRIWDNGLGFEPEKQSRGLGIEGMQERAKLIGASFEIFSHSGQGTEIIFSQALPSLPTTIG